MSCDPGNANQKWSCSENLIRLNNTILNLNYGNYQGAGRVVLFKGTGAWSKWTVFGEDENVCEKRKGKQLYENFACGKRMELEHFHL